MIAPPATEEELRERAESLCGRRLGEIAARAGWPVPTRSAQAKGWAGQLVEAVLGASAGSLSEPDFREIGVELKTLPVTSAGVPRESTYVCVVPLEQAEPPVWERSAVHRKLSRVLWLPIGAEPDTAIAERTIGWPLLWSPSEAEEAALRADWEELMDLVCMGRVHEITARHGTWLQIRPKGADSRARQRGVGEDGARVMTAPRGFYLRTAFTRALLARHYAGASCP